MTYFRGVNRPEVCSRAVWVGLLSNSLGLFALYPLIGLDAAAWGISLGFVARSIYLAVVFKRLSSQSYSETWSVRRADIQLMWDWGRRAFARLAPAISGRRS